MNGLKALLHETVSKGLKRSSIDRPSRWAEMYRVMGSPIPGPYSFKHHPWCRDMHDCESPVMVGQKAAQLGYTEVALNKTFYVIDILQASVLYVLPATKPDASDFSSSRFDAALDLSPHLRKLFSDTKNVGHKRAGQANLYIRGSKSRSQLKSVAVSLVIGDEVEEFSQKNIPLLQERTAGQFHKQLFFLSTPFVKDLGINAMFNDSTMEHYFFNCPSCNKLINLEFPRNLVITATRQNDPDITRSHLICHECKTILKHDEKLNWISGQWVPQEKSLTRGFYINQLYSPTTSPVDIARVYLTAKDDPADMQEFMNSKMGLTYEPKDARLTETQIKECQGDYLQKSKSKGGLLTMGIDVGKMFHYEIDEWYQDTEGVNINDSFIPKVLREGAVKNLNDLVKLVKLFDPSFLVIDANPERRLALQLCEALHPRARRCFYMESKKILQETENEEYAISADRTYWMDLALKRFRKRRIRLPQNLCSEYSVHLKEPIRIMQKDKWGNPIARYVTNEKKADHLAHARVYAELALPFAVSLQENKDIRNFL